MQLRRNLQFKLWELSLGKLKPKVLWFQIDISEITALRWKLIYFKPKKPDPWAQAYSIVIGTLTQ